MVYYNLDINPLKNPSHLMQSKCSKRFKKLELEK